MLPEKERGGTASRRGGTCGLRVEFADVMDVHVAIRNEVTITLDVQTVVIPIDACSVVTPKRLDGALVNLRWPGFDILNGNTIASCNAAKFGDCNDLSLLIHDVLLLPNRRCERREFGTLLNPRFNEVPKTITKLFFCDAAERLPGILPQRRRNAIYRPRMPLAQTDVRHAAQTLSKLRTV